jgi:hypothetical protein
MRRLSLILIALAALLAAFCAWGMFTPGGNAAFDEMAGMIPFFAGVAAALLAALAATTWLLSLRRR